MSKIPKLFYQKLQKQYSRRINLDLNRIQKVLEKLDNPQNKINNVINIIGSDGKNSVLTCLKYFFEANNQKLNTFTSPHLYDLRQRFWLKNRFISLKEIKKYKKIVEKTKLKLTLFELITCIYILAASRTDINSINLVEAGLLFAKDSTNLWSAPLAQVITNINYQHQEWVYPKTLNEICRQKVGYLSHNTKIYVGKQKQKTKKIIKNILKKNPSEIINHGSWKIFNKNNKKYYKDKGNLIILSSKHIHSDGLWENVGLAIKIALDFGIKVKLIKKTIPKIKFEGRVQFIKGKLTKNLKNTKILIDGCHSEESSRNLAKYLRTCKLPIYGIWGSLKNKDPKKLIKNFKGIFKKIATVNIPEEPNAENSNNLYKIASKFKFNAIDSKNVKSALSKFSDKKKKIIVIFGSLYLAGHVLSIN